MTIENKCPTIARYFFPGTTQDDLDSLAIFDHQAFTDLYNANLPVIPRNRLVNRLSKNLFYEEVLPKHTVLWFISGRYRFCQDPERKDYEKDRRLFENAFRFYDNFLQSDTIQMGANASIGYGMTSIHNIIESN